MRDRLALPDFLWLLRDVDTIPVAAADSPTHYVRQILKKNKSCGLGSILEFFPSFHCLTIPPPSADNAILADITNNLDNLSVHFNSGVATAVEHMLNTIKVKVGYGGSNIKCDGSMLTCMIEQYFTIINQPNSVIPTFQASWLMAVELKLRRMSESLVSEYERDMRAELEGKLPLREGKDGERGVTLMNIHLQVFARKRLQFQETILSFLSPSHSASAKLSELESRLIADFDIRIVIYGSESDSEVTGGQLFRFVQDNIKLSEDLCTSLYDAKYNQIVHTTLQNALSHQMPATVDQELLSFHDAYFREAQGPAVFSVYEKMRFESSKLEADLKLIPGPVEELEVVGVDADRVKIRWKVPEVNPLCVKFYEVLIKTKGKDWELVSTRSGCSALVVGLRSSMWYCLSVRANSRKFKGNKVQFVRVRTLLSKYVQQTVHASAVLASPVVYPCMVAYAASGTISQAIQEKSPLGVIAGGFMLTLLPVTAVIGMTPIAGALASSDQYKKEISDRLGDLSEKDTEVLVWEGPGSATAVRSSHPQQVDVPDSDEDDVGCGVEGVDLRDSDEDDAEGRDLVRSSDVGGGSLAGQH